MIGVRTWFFVFRQISESRDASLSRSNSNQTLCWNTRGSNQNLAGPDFTNLTAQVRSLNYVCCISCTCISELIRLRANIGEKKPVRVFLSRPYPCSASDCRRQPWECGSVWADIRRQWRRLLRLTAKDRRPEVFSEPGKVRMPVTLFSSFAVHTFQHWDYYIPFTSTLPYGF